jgi:Flp pilus assembly protein TadG
MIRSTLCHGGQAPTARADTTRAREPERAKALGKLLRDRRGAVYVEFLVAFLPLFIFFECLVQLSGMLTAKLVVQHAAVTATRAAVVVLHDDPANYGDEKVGSATGKRLEAIELAAAIPMRSVRSIIDYELNFPSQPGGTDTRSDFGRDDLVRVRVKATYRCQVPIASRIVCNFISSTRNLTGEAALPNQGADYEY